MTDTPPQTPGPRTTPVERIPVPEYSPGGWVPGFELDGTDHRIGWDRAVGDAGWDPEPTADQVTERRVRRFLWWLLAVAAVLGLVAWAGVTAMVTTWALANFR